MRPCIIKARADWTGDAYASDFFFLLLASSSVLGFHSFLKIHKQQAGPVPADARRQGAFRRDLPANCWDIRCSALYSIRVLFDVSQSHGKAVLKLSRFHMRTRTGGLEFSSPSVSSTSTSTLRIHGCRFEISVTLRSSSPVITDSLFSHKKCRQSLLYFRWWILLTGSSRSRYFHM